MDACGDTEDERRLAVEPTSSWQNMLFPVVVALLNEGGKQVASSTSSSSHECAVRIIRLQRMTS